jgi:flagellar basal-body rod protein FlgC
MMHDMFRASRVAASSLKAHRGWMNAISNNIANVHSVDTGQRSKDGNRVPYARQVPVFAKVLSEKFRRSKVNENVLNGVEVKRVAHLQNNVRKVYEPDHPAARIAGTEDAGYVYYPKISVAQELADLRMAAASYEANLAVLDTSKQMMERALSIGKRG